MSDVLDSRSFLPLRFSGNQLTVLVDAAPESITDRSGLEYRLTIYVPTYYQSGTYQELTTLYGREQPAEAGQSVWASFDIDTLIDSLLERSTPSLKAEIKPVAGLTTPFYVVTGIYNNTVLVDGTTFTNPVQVALKGKLSTEEFAIWRDAFFSVYLADYRRFLTWASDGKTIDPAQPEWLYYLVNFTVKPSKLRLRGELTFDDGTSETLTLLELTSVGQYTVYSIPAGFSQLSLSERETDDKLIFSYRLWVSDQDNKRLSEIRTYYVSQSVPRNVRYIVFANSLGGFDTVRMTGTSSQQLKLKSVSSQRPLPVDYLPSSAELFQSGKAAERTLTVNTGYADDPENLDYWQELAFSEEIYVLTKEGLVALVSDTDSYKPREDDENFGARTFTFKFAKTETGFSKLPVLPDLTASRPTMWQAEGPYCVVDPVTGLRTGMVGAARLRLYYADNMNPVPGVRTKSNVPGTEGYTPPVASDACAVSTTPYRNTLQTRSGTYERNNCSSGVGEKATLTIAANTYGGETPEQLAARIEAAFTAMDTQEYANTHAVCNLTPWVYARSMPANHFCVRTNRPDLFQIVSTPSTTRGNTFAVQPLLGSPYVYPQGSNDMIFPIFSTSASDINDYNMTFGNGGGTITFIQLYCNGVEISHFYISSPETWGFWGGFAFVPADGHKFYVRFS